MPRLSEQQVAQVEKAEEIKSGFEPLPEGPYSAILAKVEERQGREYPYWSWEFTDLVDAEGNSHPGRQWFTTSTSPKSAGFLKAAFLAFGFTPDSDTDEIIGEPVVIHVAQEVQEVGANAGKLRNTVTHLSEYKPSDWKF